MSTDVPSHDFETTLRELNSVQAEIAELPETDFVRRQELRDREAELRAELRSFNSTWTDHESIDQLERRIAVVTKRIEDHYGNRLSHTSGGQTGMGGGLDPQVLHWMHRVMDKSANLEAMQAELARLKDRLAKLMGD